MLKMAKNVGGVVLDMTDQPRKQRRVSIRTEPEEQEVLRERLTIARVMNGFSLAEAQDRLGTDDVNIERIESGKSQPPKDWAFLHRAAKAYAVSSDFLIGLTNDPDLDDVCSQRYALMRGFEGVIKQQMEATTAAFHSYANSQTRISRSQFEALTDAVDAVRRAVDLMRLKYGFDEVRGSAPVLAALGSAEHALKPIRKVLAAQREIETTLRDFAIGKAGPLAFLVDERNGVIVEP